MVKSRRRSRWRNNFYIQYNKNILNNFYCFFLWQIDFLTLPFVMVMVVIYRYLISIFSKLKNDYCIYNKKRWVSIMIILKIDYQKFCLWLLLYFISEIMITFSITITSKNNRITIKNYYAYYSPFLLYLLLNK